MNLHQYKVGELYHPDRTYWPEASEYNYRNGGHELRLFLNRPTGQEINAVKRGASEFALFVDLPVLLFCYRFLPALPWSDCPYSIHLVPEAERVAPELPQPFSERALLSVVLVNAATGIIAALRAVTLSPEFTAELHDAIRRQAEAAWNPAQFDQKLSQAYTRFASSDALAQAAQIRCDGGRDAR